MQQINIVLDVYSILLTLSLGIFLWVRMERREKLNQFFLLMCLFNLGMLLGDMTNWVSEGNARPWLPFILSFGTVLYYACSGPLLLSFIGYVIVYLSPKVVVHRAVWPTACILTAVQLVLSILSLWTGIYFYIGEGNRYMRGHFFWLSQCIPLLIYVLAVSLIVYYRRFLRWKDVVFLLGDVVIPLIAEVIQSMNYGIALMNTGSTFALFLIFINIQSERELLIQKQKNDLVEARMDMMMSQIQPHFLYNMLAVIRQLCNSRPGEAKAAIQDLSMFLRGNLNALLDKEPILFERELSHTRYYLELERRRFGERLKVVFEIHAKDFKVPPLSLQPIVENAVRHGIMKQQEGGTVTIRSEQIENAFLITVLDDGPGFLTGGAVPAEKEKRQDTYTGIGIENVRNRLGILCKGTLTIESELGKGTRAVLVIPEGNYLGNQGYHT